MSTPPSTVLADSEAKIRFHFSSRSKIENPISIDEDTAIIHELDKPLAAKTDVILENERGTVVLTPMGYAVTLPVRKLSEDVLTDKYETALMFLDTVVDDNTRKFNPAVILTGNNPAHTYNEHKDTLLDWGERTFNTEGEKRTLGENKHVSIRFRGGDTVSI